RARSADQATRLRRGADRRGRAPQARSVGTGDRVGLGVRGGRGARRAWRGRASAYRHRAGRTSRAPVDAVLEAGIVERSCGACAHETQRAEAQRGRVTSEAGETLGGSACLERAQEAGRQAAPRLAWHLGPARSYATMRERLD